MDFLIRIRTFALRNERWLVYIYLTGGFVFDLIFFRRVDLFFENFAIIAHLVLGMLAIIAVHIERGKRYKNAHAFLPLVMQFAIGGLFGKFVIFYAKSGTYISSWPFLLILVALFIGNEFLRERYALLNFRIALFFVALFSYCIFFVPVLTGSIGVAQFMESGIVSLLIMLIVLGLLRYLATDIGTRQWAILIGIVLAIYAAFNGLYFTKSIPPIPLVLKDSGIYHSVERKPDGSYVVQGEARPWLPIFHETVHWDENGTLYAWASIFAPTGLSTKIAHRWEYLQDGQWKTVGMVYMTISGGRDEGFRGYSAKRRVATGEWRVDVETERGELLGRIPFVVVATDTPPTLIEDTF